MKDSFVEEGFMTQKSREQRVRYKLDESMTLNQEEIKIYNVPFAGNTNTCKETFVKGERILEYCIEGDLTMEQLIGKPIFRDELVEYLYSISRQMVSMVHNGLKLGKIVFDLKYMYVRLNDFSVQLIFLPFDNQSDMTGVEEFIRSFLSVLVYAHTPAIECANQIIEYLNGHKEFNAIQFNLFIRELRAQSQLLVNTEKTSSKTKEIAANHAKTETDILRAEEAARNAEIARLHAESEAKRLAEYAKQQANVARSAEEMRMLAEAARIQAEIDKQAAEKEYNNKSQTAVLYACKMREAEDENSKKEINTARLLAEEQASQAEEEFRRASAEAERLAEEVRLAREEEMRAEEARMRAEYEARKNNEEARKLAMEVRRRNEEIGRLSEDRQTRKPDDSEDETTVLSKSLSDGLKRPILVRKRTGEKIYINKQVFCMGKADQGVDFKITDNKSVSRRHAYITNINGVYYLRDNNSTNHTYLNGEMLYSNIEVVIPDNSTIQLSNEEFFFKIK